MENYLLFILTAMLIIIMPGPGFALVTKNTIAYGKNGGMKTVLGTISGMMIHTIMATLGLSAILMKFSMLFTFIKYAGAFYLIYLAVKSIKSAFLKKKICKFYWKGTLRILGRLKVLDKDLQRQS